MTDNDDKLINAARAFVGLTVEVAEVRTILLRALDALARERRDALREEIHKDEKLLPNSFGTVRERVVRDEFAAYIRLTPAQVAAMDDGAYHQLDLFRDDAGVRWLIDGKDPTP